MATLTILHSLVGYSSCTQNQVSAPPDSKLV